eukprot:1188789-Prorocentrum_minimum.AAC.2
MDEEGGAGRDARGGVGAIGGAGGEAGASVAVRVRIPKWALGGGAAPEIFVGGKALRDLDPDRWRCGATPGVQPIDSHWTDRRTV